MIRHFGRATLCGLAGLALAGASAADNTNAREAADAATATQIPIKDFARISDVFDAKLSPNGARLALKTFGEERAILSLMDLTTGKTSSVRLGNVAGWNEGTRYIKQVEDFAWAGDERVIIQSNVPATGASGGLSSVDHEAQQWVGLTGDSRSRDRQAKQQGMLLQNVLLHASPSDSRHALMLESPQPLDYHHPHVVKVDIRTGEYQRVLSNPGDVIRWLPDQTGQICGAVVLRGDHLRVRYRRDGDSPWKECGDLELKAGQVQLLGIFAQHLYFLKPGASGRLAVYAYALEAASEPLQLIFEDPEYDVASANGYLPIGQREISPLVFEPGTGRLLGVRYMAEGPKHHWFDSSMAEVQRQLDTSMPDFAHMVVSMDRTGRQMLVFSWSARNPGFFSTLNLDTWKFKTVAWTRGWVKIDAAAEMYPVKFKARDGLELHGYLTLPVGSKQQGLPAVVMVHHGPWTRDVWGYNNMVQFLANRGYAVLQVDYRGSTGYGEEFHRAGFGALGGAMIDDIIDATQWAVARKLIDPRRIAVMGMSFGGYNALAAMARAPELYRCGVGVAALCDWDEMVRHKEERDYLLAYPYWSTLLGAGQDAALSKRLGENAPARLAESMRGPVLLVHSKADNAVPIQQMYAMRAALKRHDKAVETLTLENAGHGYPGGENGIEFLKRLEKFLAKHLEN